MDLSSDVKWMLLQITIPLAVIWIILKWLEYRKLPPGPFGFPFIGYVPFMTKEPHLDFCKLAKRYGDVIYINMGPTTMVVISDWETAKQALTNPTTFARPLRMFQLLPGVAGFGFYRGAKWQEQRRFCVTSMKDLGMGRGEWETMIHDETAEYTEEIKSWSGKPRDFLPSLEVSQAGNTLSLLLGRRLPKDTTHPETKIFMDFVQMVIPFLSPASVLIHMPKFVVKVLRCLGFSYVNELLKSFEDFEDLIRKEIKSTELHSRPTDKPTFISSYLEEMKNQSRNDKVHYFSTEALVGNVTALFLGGVDTIKVSLHWLLLLIAAHPDVQNKIHSEIDEVAGRDRQIYWDERNNFPYIMATIQEAERWIVVTPLLPIRQAIETTTIGHYTIPKDTTVVVNAWAIMRSEKYFEAADDFKPERFLNNEKGQLRKLDGYLPFSVGKRNCPGEHVAMMTIFLYITAIMQKFRLACPDGKTMSFQDMGMGATRNAIPQELCFIQRNL